MKERFTKNQQELVEAVVGLFILIPNPELKDKKDRIMKIAFENLAKMIDSGVKIEEPELTQEELEADELYYQFIMEEIEDNE